MESTKLTPEERDHKLVQEERIWRSALYPNMFFAEGDKSVVHHLVFLTARPEWSSNGVIHEGGLGHLHCSCRGGSFYGHCYHRNNLKVFLHTENW